MELKNIEFAINSELNELLNTAALRVQGVRPVNLGVLLHRVVIKMATRGFRQRFSSRESKVTYLVYPGGNKDRGPKRKEKNVVDR